MPLIAAVCTISSSIIAKALAIVVEDTFNRSDGSLGSTSTGNVAWEVLSGDFAIVSNTARSVPANANSGIAVVETYTPNVNLSIDTSSGGDALYFRVVDDQNWWRLVLDRITEATQTAYGHTEYHWYSSRGGAEYYPTSAELSAGCQQTYHDHYSDWPTRNAWGTSSTSPPAGIAYNDYTHTHAITLAGCGQSVTYTHTHAASHFYGSTQFVIDGYTTTYSYYTNFQLQKSLSNVISNVGGPSTQSVSSVQAILDGSSITIRKDSAVTDIITSVSSDNISGTKHGFGRATSNTVQNSTFDNFSAVPI